MVVQIKTLVKNPRITESGFTLNQIMHLHVNFSKLPLTRGSSYTELPKWMLMKRAIINGKNNGKQFFK